MKTHIKLSKENREKLIAMMAKADLQNVDAIASFLGLEDGINLEFFEYCIRKDGFTPLIKRAITKAFAGDITEAAK